MNRIADDQSEGQEPGENRHQAPANDGAGADVADAVRELRTLRDGIRPEGLDWKRLRDQGRR